MSRHSREACPREGGERESTMTLDSPASSTGQACQARNDKQQKIHVVVYSLYTKNREVGKGCQEKFFFFSIRGQLDSFMVKSKNFLLTFTNSETSPFPWEAVS